MELIVGLLIKAGIIGGLFTLLTRNMILKFFLGIWSAGAIVLSIFNDNLAAQFAAEMPNVFGLLLTPWVVGWPVVITLYILKKMFFKGW